MGVGKGDWGLQCFFFCLFVLSDFFTNEMFVCTRDSHLSLCDHFYTFAFIHIHINKNVHISHSVYGVCPQFISYPM